MSDQLLNFAKVIEIYIPYSLTFSNDNRFLVVGGNNNYDICVYDTTKFE